MTKLDNHKRKIVDNLYQDHFPGESKKERKMNFIYTSRYGAVKYFVDMDNLPNEFKAYQDESVIKACYLNEILYLIDDYYLRMIASTQYESYYPLQDIYINSSEINNDDTWSYRFNIRTMQYDNRELFFTPKNDIQHEFCRILIIESAKSRRT